MITINVSDLQGLINARIVALEKQGVTPTADMLKNYSSLALNSQFGLALKEVLSQADLFEIETETPKKESAPKKNKTKKK